MVKTDDIFCVMKNVNFENGPLLRTYKFRVSKI